MASRFSFSYGYGILAWKYGTLHDIILPVVPLLLGWEYDVGYWLLSHPHELPPRLRLSHQSPAIWFHWPTFSP